MIDFPTNEMDVVKKLLHSQSGSDFPGGLLCKKQVFFLLRPDAMQYRSNIVRAFFTPERLRRCGISPEEYPRIRIFSAEATAIIRHDLKNLLMK